MRFAAVLLVLILGAIALAWAVSRPPSPDAFYAKALPPGAEPGTLVASEPFARSVPPNARGWRILYTTTRGGVPVLASAVIVVPSAPGVSRPVIAWAHGTTGVVAGCAPSMLARPFDNFPDLDAVLREGWGYVGTDYPGLGTSGGHTYLVGEDAARAVLDAVRAARQLPEAGLGDRMVIWGHSQGGHAALWAGIRAADYARELDLAGVAALAPATDLSALLISARGGVFGKMISAYLVQSYGQAYPEIASADYVDPLWRPLAADIASRCASGYGALFSVAETALLPDAGLFSRDPTTGPLGERLIENTPRAPIPAPVLIAQGEADDLVAPGVQDAFVAARCAEGEAIAYRTYPGRDHLSLVAVGSPLAPELLAWTRDRFAGRPSHGNCPH